MPLVSKYLMQSTIQKPENHILKLMQTLTPLATQVSDMTEKKLPFYSQNKNMCYLLESGHVIIYRVKDNLTLNTETAPCVFGLSQHTEANSGIAIRSSNNAVVYQLPLKLAKDTIKELNLWQHMAYVLMYISSRLYAHCTRMSLPGSYETVRHLLLELSHEVEEIRAQKNVVRYIRNRSFLSRSGVMHIISQLKRGNYIEVENGKLTKINQLPERF